MRRRKLNSLEVRKSSGARERLYAELNKMRERMQRGEDRKAVKSESARACNSEAARGSADDDEAASAHPEEAGSEQPGSGEARRKRNDRALAAVSGTIGNLSRYETSLMTALTRTFALLQLYQGLHIQRDEFKHLLAPLARSNTD